MVLHSPGVCPCMSELLHSSGTVPLVKIPTSASGTGCTPWPSTIVNPGVTAGADDEIVVEAVGIGTSCVALPSGSASSSTQVRMDSVNPWSSRGTRDNSSTCLESGCHADHELQICAAQEASTLLVWHSAIFTLGLGRQQALQNHVYYFHFGAGTKHSKTTSATELQTWQNAQQTMWETIPTPIWHGLCQSHRAASPQSTGAQLVGCRCAHAGYPSVAIAAVPGKNNQTSTQWSRTSGIQRIDLPKRHWPRRKSRHNGRSASRHARQNWFNRSLPQCRKARLNTALMRRVGWGIATGTAAAGGGGKPAGAGRMMGAAGRAGIWIMGACAPWRANRAAWPGRPLMGSHIATALPNTINGVNTNMLAASRTNCCSQITSV